MSFGFSAGDFMTLGQLCWTVYKKCKESLENYKELVCEVGALHNVIKETEELLSQQQLSKEQSAKLDMSRHGCQEVLQDLSALLARYDSLGTKTQRTFDRIGFATKDVNGIRNRLISNVTLLDAFNNVSSNARLENKLNILIAEIRAGKREGSVTSMEVVNCASRRDQIVWGELRRELEDVGISPDVIAQKSHYIVIWFREALASGRLEEVNSEYDASSGNDSYDDMDSARSGGSDAETKSSNRESDFTSESESQTDLYDDCIVGEEEDKATTSSNIKDEPIFEKGSQSTLRKACRKAGEEEEEMFPKAEQNKPLPRCGPEIFLEKDYPKVGKNKNGSACITQQGELSTETGRETKSDKNNFKKEKIDKEGDSETRDKFTTKSSSKIGLDTYLRPTFGAQVALEDGRSNRPPRNVRFQDSFNDVSCSRRESDRKISKLQMSALFDRVRGYERRLIEATITGDAGTLRKLLEKGADVQTRRKRRSSNENETLLHLAAMRGHEVAVQLLLEMGADIDATDNLGHTALHHATAHQHQAVLRHLLDEGADMEIRNGVGEAALHISTKSGDKASAQQLLQRGANVDSRIKCTHLTSLHLAVALGETSGWETVEKQEDFIRLLVQYGADVDAHDRSGRSPWSLARKTGQERIVQLLLAARYV